MAANDEYHQQPLRRVSSLVLNLSGSPAQSEIQKETKFDRGPHGGRRLKAADSRTYEIVPDSEEERLRHQGEALTGSKDSTPNAREVIEISSDEDHGVISFGKSRSKAEDDHFLDSIPGSWPIEQTKATDGPPIFSSKVLGKAKRAQNSQPRHHKHDFSSECSDSDQGDPDVVELTDSSPERHPTPKTKLRRPVHRRPGPVISDGLWDANDGSVLTLDEPKNTHKLIRRLPMISDGSSMSSEKSPVSESGERTTRAIDPATDTPSGSAPSAFLATPSGNKTSSKSLGTPKKTRGKSKAVLEAEEKQARLQKYAQELFEDLNKVVFKDRLPAAHLKWSKTLRTTAGKANWHRDRNGVNTCKIDLAVKILDCEERIRNTLAHEMCHLASWIISEEPNAGHGKIWKAWAERVMTKRPHIEVSTKHEYEIAYKYNWECGKCAKIYGRHSMSVNPDEVVCGACEVGRLVPLFTVKKRAPRMPKSAAMANANPQGSPLSLPRHSSTGAGHPSVSLTPPQPLYAVCDSDHTDSDIEILATSLGIVKVSSCDMDD